MQMILIRIKFVLASLAVVLGLFIASSTTTFGQETEEPDFRAEFFKLCDVACEYLNKEKLSRPFFEDSYAVRALAVAYDMTGEKKYLDACKVWSDQMVKFQTQMIPKGFYYMNYSRKPGENKGGCYVADCSSIAMGVLATAVRCTDQADKHRYLNSVKSFAKLVMDNYVASSGGICNGCWGEPGKAWWCCSGQFCALAFLLYEETGDEQYRKVALNALDWLNRLDYRKVDHWTIHKGAPAVIMYIFESHSAGMPHLEAGTEREKVTLAKISEALKWMSENQKGKGQWKNYNSGWGPKLGGLPSLMYVFSRHMPEGETLRTAADQELCYISSLLFERKGDANLQPKTSWQFKTFSMISYAEKLSPGVLYRKTK